MRAYRLVVGRERRFIEPDGIYHVTCRGSNRGTIAWDTFDFDSLYRELDKAAKLHSWDVFSWCFMDNHYHALLRTPDGGFSDGFQVMNGAHSRRTNRRHGRSDHLFRNRPRCTPVRSQAHFVNALLYVARNPVLHGAVSRPEDWPFGSYRALAGLAAAPPWLAVAEVHQLFGSDEQTAAAEFVRLVRDGHLMVSDTESELLSV